MEYWSVEKKDINLFVITPILQYSEINLKRMINHKKSVGICENPCPNFIATFKGLHYAYAPCFEPRSLSRRPGFA